MALDEEKLKKFLLVALSTDQPGEAHAALSQVNKLLKKAGKDIHWLADRLVAPVKEIYQQPAPYSYNPPYTPPEKPPYWGVDWRSMMLHCSTYPEKLRPRERDFILSLIRQSERMSFSPSIKQMEWLEAIYARVSS